MHTPSRHRCAIFALSLAAVLWGGPQPARAGGVNVIELDNQVISPITQEYVLEAISQSEASGAECLVLILDTPGGLLESTRSIVKRIMNSRVPVVVYVGPSGARAGSAGVFITLAGHIAAMAPSTNIGAAHPVMAGGGGGPVKKLIRRIKRAAKDELSRRTDGDREKAEDADEEEIIEEEEHDPMSAKIMNDTVAWAMTIAKARGRNEEWAKKAVVDSFSVGEQEAVRERIVDLIAKDLAELLEKIDGWPVQTIAGERTLATQDARISRVEMTPRQQLLAVITNPNIAYLLMLLGTLGLIFEFTHPGVGFPGIAGLICLILALYAFQTLPTNYAALGLIGLGVVLLIAEVKVAGFGLLAMGGVVALTLGSLLLFDSPEGFGVSLAVIAPVVIGVSGIILFLVSLVIRAHRQPVKAGASGLIGLQGIAQTDLSPSGQVFVHGEIWSAVASEPIRQGELVKVVQVDGLTLRVTRAGS